MLVEVAKGAFVVGQEQRAEVPAEVVAHQDALDSEVLTVLGQRIGRYLPPLCPQPVGQVEEGKTMAYALAELPGERWYAAVAVVDDLERANLSISSARYRALS